MDGAQFIVVLSRSMARRVELERAGLSPEEIESLLDTFRIRERHGTAGHDFNSELEKLVAEHDCSTVEVGMVRLLGGPIAHPEGVQVGVVEADPLVVLRDGSVKAFDLRSGQKVFDCASDSRHFLDGLATFAEIVHELPLWKMRADEASERCAAKSGGPEYRQFFRVMCEFMNH